VVTDNAFGHPKGFGFVRFSDEAESLKAIEEMHGTYIGSKPVRVSAASKKDSTTIETDSNVPASAYSYPYYNYGYYDTTSYAGYAGYGAKGQDFSAYFLRYSDVKQDNYQYVTLQMMMIDDEEDHGSLTKFGL
jgi:RNA recognition motif-containing protein